ncbi:MAG: DNA repair protein RecN [Lentisphaerae bacterium]|nr:DNA repair protein RecN [Lentisphaerota bacterium]
MLQTLRVRDLAIVENVRVDFEPGLNVITGETGAGKSVIIGALGLVLGERADKTLIRAGCEQCGVEAAFRLPDPSAVDAALDELGIPPCDDGQCVVRRIVSAAGGSRITINDSAATVQSLKRIGDLLVDIHGPYDHQSLLSRDFQLDLLDSYGHLWGPRDAYEALHRRLSGLQAQRRELEADDGDVARQIEMLAFQLKEIEEARLDETNEEDLRNEHARVANAQRILELANGICAALTEDETSAFSGMAAAQKMLGEMAGVMPEAAEWNAEARAVAIQVQELAASVSAAAQRVESDPGRLQWIEDRLALLHKLKRKYGASVAEIAAFRDRSAERLSALQNRGARIRELEESMAETRRQMESAGMALRAGREKAARGLAAAVTRELKDLGFAQGVFTADLEPCEPCASGLDAIEFGFAPNPGEPLRPLRSIASGGEISRVMLAGKSVLAAHDRIPVLVFDEIDVNIGGETGSAVGAKLAAVAANHQVLCITHLPQVAVHGATHYLVAKEVQAGRTATSIRRLEDRERVEEVARMLGGKDISSVVLRHAREMLARTAER